MNAYIDIVFDGPPGPKAGRFVEVEDASGRGMRFGEWIHRPDGFWALRIQRPDRPGRPRPHALSADAAEAIGKIVAELANATQKFPTWPTDPLHALAVLGEEFGELTKAMLQLTYEPDKTSAAHVRAEAVQTAAMALRLVMSLDRYEYMQCHQHYQDASREQRDAAAQRLRQVTLGPERGR